MLLQGGGLKSDEPKAIDFLRAAAEKGVVGAQNRLGYVYAEGIGVTKDKVEAAKWRLIAKSNGLTDDDKLDQLVASLSNGDRQKAEKAASAWRVKPPTVN